MNSSPTQRREDKGFTLIELMVVVLIIAILLAIAIPTFLGAQNKAKDRSAQSSARNALTNAKTIFADTGTYSLRRDVTGIANLKASEPSLTFASPRPRRPARRWSRSSDVGNNDTWYGAVWSHTGTCFYIKDSVAAGGPGTMYGKSTVACQTAPAHRPSRSDTGGFYKTDW